VAFLCKKEGRARNCLPKAEKMRDLMLLRHGKMSPYTHEKKGKKGAFFGNYKKCREVIFAGEEKEGLLSA